MVKLQRRFAYRYKGKEGNKDHYKYVITIPEGVIEQLDWKEGTELEPVAQDRKLVVEPVAKSRKEKD